MRTKKKLVKKRYVHTGMRVLMLFGNENCQCCPTNSLKMEKNRKYLIKTHHMLYHSLIPAPLSFIISAVYAENE